MELLKMNSQAIFEALSPVGASTVEKKPLAPRLSDLNGKTVCELDGGMFRAHETLPIIRQLLKKRYPEVKFIFAGEIKPPDLEAQAISQKEKSLEAFRIDLMEKGCDAIIVGNGG